MELPTPQRMLFLVSSAKLQSLTLGILSTAKTQTCLWSSLMGYIHPFFMADFGIMVVSLKFAGKSVKSSKNMTLISCKDTVVYEKRTAWLRGSFSSYAWNVKPDRRSLQAFFNCVHSVQESSKYIAIEWVTWTLSSRFLGTTLLCTTLYSNLLVRFTARRSSACCLLHFVFPCSLLYIS